MNEVNPAGMRRPIMRGPSGRMTPAPWVAGEQLGRADGGRWSYVDEYRANIAEINHLCIVCGTHRGDDWVYGLLFGKPYDHITTDPVERIFNIGSPATTYGHPECILKAALYCPHLQRQDYPAMTQDRTTKLTVDDLKDIVKKRKTLKAKPESFAIGGAKVATTRGPRKPHLV